MMDWDSGWFDGSIVERHMLAWREVEAQHVVATMRLADTPAEQSLLEQLLEGSKPPMPVTAQRQHFLLTTPFRYHPAHASRFRPARASGLWYGADTVFAVCAEVAYWRHRFILDNAGLLDQVSLTQHTLFQAQVDGASIDLMALPWVQARAAWSHGSDDSATQAVRAPGRRCAVVLDPDSLSEPACGLESTMQNWHCKATRDAVMCMRGRECFRWYP
ncbi:RES family NAD+ phosphorylase [Verminephrobacter eiseniae]|uniref:RES family NAD+ phosphorylase n=1 Tax=Verminephrobacter eiseniae TaxID=364317 RepID=UPI002237A0D2|nr:RES family NAD+ phosphorylase [Verminephrobacter eiseniae]MCW5236802.1 RES domain-containing protein [Verminephrobacter eiseniae]